MINLGQKLYLTGSSPAFNLHLTLRAPAEVRLDTVKSSALMTTAAQEVRKGDHRQQVKPRCAYTDRSAVQRGPTGGLRSEDGA
jgi:hypothetical protein